MKIISLEMAKKIKFKNVSVALGTFDGLHVGHMALISALKEYGGDSVVFTFDSLPSDLLLDDQKPMRLFTLGEKKDAFKNAGIDYLCITAFDRKFANIDKDDFASLILKVFSPVNIVAGYNYTYGKHAMGNVDTLSETGKKYGCNINIIPPVIFDGEPVSATRIRECIEAGSIVKANALLGYRYSLSGAVTKGAGLGSKLGFPTANVKVAREKVVPMRGVYSVDVCINGDVYKGVCNIGVRPTVSSNEKETIEIHIVSLSKDLYGENIKVIFNKRLRDEMKFRNTDTLIEQIKKDITNI